MADVADDPKKSPTLNAMKKPSNEVMKKMRHNRNLSDVLEENSSLSSGQVSVDKKYLSPDMLLQKRMRLHRKAGNAEVNNRPPFRIGTSGGG